MKSMKFNIENILNANKIKVETIASIWISRLDFKLMFYKVFSLPLKRLAETQPQCSHISWLFVGNSITIDQILQWIIINLIVRLSVAKIIVAKLLAGLLLSNYFQWTWGSTEELLVFKSFDDIDSLSGTDFEK